MDKTFDIKSKEDTNFNEEMLCGLKNDKIVHVETNYEDDFCSGVIVQVASERNHLQSFLEDVIFYFFKNYSIEKILQLQHIPRFNTGARPHFPARCVSLVNKKILIIITLCQLFDISGDLYR